VELLVDDVCTNVKLINRLVLDYNSQMEVLFSKVRSLQAASLDRDMFERYIYESQQGVAAFKTALIGQDYLAFTMLALGLSGVKDRQKGRKTNKQLAGQR
jgi:hypothetical protein